MDFKKINSAVIKYSIRQADPALLVLWGNQLKQLIFDLPVCLENQNLRNKYKNLLLYCRGVYRLKNQGASG